MTFEAVPTDLKSRDRWLCWCVGERNGEKTKLPVNPATGKVDDATDSSVWTSFEEARQAHAGDDLDTAGVGFAFTPEDTIVGVDIDDARDPDSGEPTPEAQAIIDELDSWTEVSASGTGYHVFVHGILPDGGSRGDIDARSHIEIYDSGRFFALTGDHVEGTPTEVQQRAQSLREVHSEYVADKEEKADSDDSTAPAPQSTGTVDLSDIELLEKAKNSTNGDEFYQLWKGNTAGYESHSEADLALCNYLAFWTDNDKQRIDSLFRDSGLMREKWDEQRGDRTYGEMTIDTATNDQKDTYGTEPALADGGATTQQPTTTTGTTGTLTPQELALQAGLTEATEISKLTDRQKAAYVWRLIKQSDDVHVRVNRDNSELWAFDPETGTWSPDGERALAHAAKRTVADVNYGGNVLEELKTQVRADPEVEVYNDTFGLEAGKLAVENGLLDLEKAYTGDSDALRELEPEDYALNRLPVEYDPEADGATWKGFVGDVVDSSMINTVQEYIGYCLHRRNRFERALLLVGDGANGKSTFLNTVEAFLGTDNTTSVSPLDFGHKPSLATMHGSLANISVELEGGALQGKNLTNFKNLTGNDSVTAKRLYQDPFKFTYDGGMLFATNEVPDVPVSDDATAFWRRWIIVPFTNYFPEGSDKCDPELGERLQEPANLSALLNWAIEGWGRLMENDGFDSVPDNPHTTRQKWQQWGDSVDDFLSNVAERDSEAPNITTGEAYEVYRQWCRDNDHEAVGQHKFTNSAKGSELGYGNVRTDRHNTPRNGYRFFGTVDSERDPIEVIEEEAAGDDDNDDDTHNSGLHQYDSDDSDDDKPENGSSATDGDTEAGEAGNNADDSGGESTENTAPEGDHNAGDGDGGTWSKLLGDISKHYSDGEEITPEELVECVDRIDNTTYAVKGLEALADSGVIQREEEHYIA